MPETRDLFDVSRPIRQPLCDIDEATIRRTLAAQMDECAAVLHHWRLDLDDVLLEPYAVVRHFTATEPATMTIPLARPSDRDGWLTAINGQRAAEGNPSVGPSQVELIAVRTRVVEEVNTPLRGFAGPMDQSG
jgi:hypothetical protein